MNNKNIVIFIYAIDNIMSFQEIDNLYAELKEIYRGKEMP